jgi:hypothetical protein
VNNILQNIMPLDSPLDGLADCYSFSSLPVNTDRVRKSK